MRIDILTLFPEMFEPLNHSILKRGIDNNLFEINIVNIRDFSKDIHKKCDDYPYGGGAGMVMMAQPIFDAYKSLNNDKSKVIYASPRGKTFNQQISKTLSKEDRLVFLCGHYEGVDERAIELLGAEEISIGDYVLTGGELPVMVMIDSIVRNIKGVISSESLEEESFSSSLLEYPQYTRPEVFEDKAVPNVLLSGHHQNIEDWRKEQSVLVTQKNRPDLLKNVEIKLNKNQKNNFILNINKLNFTDLSLNRIKNNLKLNKLDNIKFIKNKILDKKSIIYKKGKNYYCKNNNILITINASSYKVITAKYIK